MDLLLSQFHYCGYHKIQKWKRSEPACWVAMLEVSTLICVLSASTGCQKSGSSPPFVFSVVGWRRVPLFSSPHRSIHTLQPIFISILVITKKTTHISILACMMLLMSQSGHNVRDRSCISLSLSYKIRGIYA